MRLIALSDGLFATVLTILVLDLKLDLAPNAISTDIFHSLVALWPHMFSYFLTFLVTGLYWLGHHRIFDHIVRYDRRLLWYNLMFLLIEFLTPRTYLAQYALLTIPVITSTMDRL